MQNGACLLPGIFRREVHVHGPGKAGLGGCVNKAGVVAGGYLHKARHDALIVHYHGFDGSGHNCQFGHEMVARHGNALAHEQFIARTAQPGHGNSRGSCLPGLLQHFRLA